MLLNSSTCSIRLGWVDLTAKSGLPHRIRRNVPDLLAVALCSWAYVTAMPIPAALWLVCGLVPSGESQGSDSRDRMCVCCDEYGFFFLP